MSKFERYIGIDYSGAETAESSLPNLRAYSASGSSQAQEIPPPPGPKKYWTRRGLAQWLRAELSVGPPTIVGIDHAFSFPLRYFERHRLAPDWPRFLDDFQQHWPTDEPNTSVEFVRDGVVGQGSRRDGDSSWLRITEQWTTSAKSVFKFDVQGQVAKSTHAGLPWLRFLRMHGGAKLHFWPFDGWTIPEGKSVVAEAYPSLWMQRFPRQDRNPDQHAAYSVACWLQRADRDGSLGFLLNPPLQPQERTIAEVEGWILGVV